MSKKIPNDFILIKDLTCRYLKELESGGFSVQELAVGFGLERTSIYKWKTTKENAVSGIPSKTNFCRLHGLYHAPPGSRRLVLETIRSSQANEVYGKLFDLMKNGGVLQETGEWVPVIGTIIGGAFGGILGGMLGAAIGTGMSGGATLASITLDEKAIRALSLDPSRPWPELLIDAGIKIPSE